MTTFTDALTRVSRAAAALAAAPTDPTACIEYDAACAALDVARANPNPTQVAELRELLDLVANFADNDQRARYLLTCDWGRANIRQAPASAAPVAEPELHDFREIAPHIGPTRDFCWESLITGYLGDCPVSGYCGRRRADHPAPGVLRWPVTAAATADLAHGYGDRPGTSWAPGYCWCGAWALDRGPDHPGIPCAGLTAILGRPPRDHEDAVRLAFLRGVGPEL